MLQTASDVNHTKSSYQFIPKSSDSFIKLKAFLVQCFRVEKTFKLFHAQQVIVDTEKVLWPHNASVVVEDMDSYEELFNCAKNCFNRFFVSNIALEWHFSWVHLPTLLKRIEFLRRRASAISLISAFAKSRTIAA